jgi:hypothetical protein
MKKVATVVAAAMAVVLTLALVGCGGPAVTVAKTVSVPEAPLTTTVTSPSATAQSDQVINQAQQAPSDQAQLGADAIRKRLSQKLGLNGQLDFNLNNDVAQNDMGSDYYVKLGADAVNFENRSENILRSPNGSDVRAIEHGHAARQMLAGCSLGARLVTRW